MNYSTKLLGDAASYNCPLARGVVTFGGHCVTVAATSRDNNSDFADEEPSPVATLNSRDRARASMPDSHMCGIGLKGHVTSDRRIRLRIMLRDREPDRDSIVNDR